MNQAEGGRSTPPIYPIVESYNNAFVDEALPLLLDAGVRAYDNSYSVETVCTWLSTVAKFRSCRSLQGWGYEMMDFGRGGLDYAVCR
jgi:hypothetical protein